MQQDAQSTIQSNQPPSPVSAAYVEVSATDALAPGAKIGDLFTLNATTPYFLQRLTERTYFFGGGFYTTTFYVGDEGVLVLDPPEGQGANLLAAIAEVTDKLVTAIAYSHNHADHIIEAPVLIAATNAAGGEDVRVIASTETDAKMRLLKSSLPAPTETVTWPNGAFDFEGLTVRLNGFTRAAHSDDAGAWLLVQEKVVHLPDLVNGDQPPFRNFGSAENYVYYRSNVNELGELDWVHLVGGHGNVGSKDDIRFHNVFLDDLEAAVGGAMASTQFGTVVDDLTKFNNHAALMDLWLKAVTAKATDQLRPKYGKYYGFEITTPANAEMVTLSMVSYR
ncbi:MBL fold metallo-hydrolase [Streptomyces prunicolor]|uniref:MBL fold metallo-hydrolase n=1 Tax=Streptomyces prunicolor TaxID=67348 RepID=UPI003868E9A3|nr:MBL fold metallo-hydrolase [Streptomyces prunicolor]